MDLALKKEEIVNMTIFLPFTFLELHNIRGTYPKYFQNIICETDIGGSVKLPYVLLQEFYIHSRYVIDLCI